MSSVYPPTKTCRKCHAAKPATLEHFYANKQCADRLHSWCRDCTKQATRARYWANPERARAERRAYAETHQEQIQAYHRAYHVTHAEKIRARATAWYEANRERGKASRRAYREAHAEEDRARSRSYHATHHERTREVGAAYRAANAARIKAAKAAYFQANKARLMARSNECRKAHRSERVAEAHRRRARERNAPGFFTAKDIARQRESQRGRCWWCQRALDHTATVDHLVPLARGGTNWPSNIVIACRPCNFSRAAKLPEEWCGRLF